MKAKGQSTYRRYLPSPLLLILGLGFVLRLWLWWRVPMHQPANDENEYLQVARDLVAGRGWVFYEHYSWLRAPLYPLFLAGSLLLTGGNLRWAALPNIAISTGTIYLFYLLGRSVAREGGASSPEGATRAERVGIAAAAMTALWLPLATFAGLWMSETLFTALFVGACLALLRWAARPTIHRAALVGALLGLAMLTRSVPMAALPLLGVWMLWLGRGRPWRRHIAGVAVCFVVMLGTIAPWTLRNWFAYGGLIPIETGLSFNLWAFNEPREDQETIFRTLESIRNPVARAAYATNKGLERLREDPTILARRIDFNWFYLWNIAPVEDRFRSPSYFEDVPLGMFVTGLVLDDGLYLLILGSALAGFLLAPWNRQKVLLGGWFAYAVATTLLTHSEGRYRQLLLPALIPFAATFWAGPQWRVAQPRRRAAVVVVALIGLLPLLHYPYSWASLNIQREVAKLAGDHALSKGDYAAAQAAYRRATEIDPASADALLRLGLAYDQSGDLYRAAEIYRSGVVSAPMYIAANARLGDVLRRIGATSAARQAFAGRYLDAQLITKWAWDNLRSPPPTTIDVGDELDLGYVDGMYAPEDLATREVRWTKGVAKIRLATSEQGTLIRVGLSAPRPDGQPVHAQLCVADQCQVIEVTAQWRRYTLFVELPCQKRAQCSNSIEMIVRSPTFVPARTTPSQALSQDTRSLGLLVDYVATAPVPDDQVGG